MEKYPSQNTYLLGPVRLFLYLEHQSSLGSSVPLTPLPLKASPLY